tara:strand:- start:6182 stop:6613 length:432 start_codon:yes stop_codon:yes gene_type:complete
MCAPSTHAGPGPTRRVVKSFTHEIPVRNGTYTGETLIEEATMGRDLTKYTLIFSGEFIPKPKYWKFFEASPFHYNARSHNLFTETDKAINYLISLYQDGNISDILKRAPHATWSRKGRHPKFSISTFVSSEQPKPSYTASLVP